MWLRNRPVAPARRRNPMFYTMYERSSCGGAQGTGRHRRPLRGRKRPKRKYARTTPGDRSDLQPGKYARTTPGDRSDLQPGRPRRKNGRSPNQKLGVLEITPGGSSFALMRRTRRQTVRCTSFAATATLGSDKPRCVDPRCTNPAAPPLPTAAPLPQPPAPPPPPVLARLAGSGEPPPL